MSRNKEQRTEAKAPPTHKDDPILTYTEAGKMIGKHRSTVGRWVKDGLLKAARHPSGLPGIRKSEIDKILTVFSP
ncbi:hypothetical protein Pla52o_35170 [Novipirellula galeiformis]|uniref:Helix-turn-helix domain protein n=1 Tax=Novipirellula galeiformis TaxID=2528004 RepID=A0A5C6CGQ7_9BACT|nr:hypothetical protein [Novipirellula galeiformis]TWU22461.1 hypothetical protein Pla52o_35170 [Novipirellula galeiformis]